MNAETVLFHEEEDIMIRSRLTKRLLGLSVLIALLLVVWLVPDDRMHYFIALVCAWAVFAVGYDFLFGLTGHLSFGHAAFLGGGAYVSGILMLEHGWPFWIAIFVAGLAMAVLALIIGLIALRTSGIYFALITLLLAQFVYVMASVKLRAYTGGVDGLIGVPRPTLGGIDFYDNRNYCILSLMCCAFALWVAARLRASPFGQVLRGIGQNALRLRQIGFDVKRYTLAAFMLSGFYAGVAGTLLGSLTMIVSPDLLNWSTSGEVIIITVLGGVGTLAGPVIGVLTIEALREILSGYTTVWHGILGALFIIFSVFLPGGLMGAITGGYRRIGEWRGRK